MKLLQLVTKLFMVQYEQMFGIADCPVSYGKYLFRAEWFMKHGLPMYNDECQSDNTCKFLMDAIRRLAQVRLVIGPACLFNCRTHSIVVSLSCSCLSGRYPLQWPQCVSIFCPSLLQQVCHCIQCQLCSQPCFAHLHVLFQSHQATAGPRH